MIACVNSSRSRSLSKAVERSETNHWGFYDRELTKNRRDWKEIYDVGPDEADGALAGVHPQWPGTLPDFRPVIETYTEAMHGLARRLLRAILRNLGESEAIVLAAFEPGHSSFLRLNWYPRNREPEGQLGIHEHTDAGALTLLLQDDQPGLQVLRNGEWHIVPPRRDALVINIGDIVQVWSNDLYAAPVHRVMANPSMPRYSAAYFYNPAPACDYAPLSGACALTGAPRYRPINWGAFRAARAAGDFADCGEEIQIHHFRSGVREPIVYRRSAPRSV
jgi:isopenicillin N synthase-like dioxygenase